MFLGRKYFILVKNSAHCNEKKKVEGHLLEGVYYEQCSSYII